MTQNNPYQAYKQQSVMTMTQGEMLTMVYDGILKELNYAKVGLDEKNYSEVNRRCQKAQTLLRYLQNSLDNKYDIANELNTLYDFFIRGIINVNVKKAPEGLDEIIQMVAELREAYIQADRKMRSAEASGKSA